jgi:hypothetical protein
VDDLAIVEQHVSGYVLALAAMVHQPSAHQADAARLASQAHRVLRLVAMIDGSSAQSIITTVRRSLRRGR